MPQAKLEFLGEPPDVLIRRENFYYQVGRISERDERPRVAPGKPFSADECNVWYVPSSARHGSKHATQLGTYQAQIETPDMTVEESDEQPREDKAGQIWHWLLKHLPTDKLARRLGIRLLKPVFQRDASRSSHGACPSDSRRAHGSMWCPLSHYPRMSSTETVGSEMVDSVILSPRR
jgi:hypothetical protein